MPYHGTIYFETQVRVRYVETDQMAVAHHSSLIYWLEVARIDYCDALGIPYKNLEASGLLIPVLELQVRYLKPIYFDDRLSIQLQMASRPSIQFQIEYCVFRKGEKVAEAKTQHVFTSPQGKVMRPPPLFWEKLTLYAAQTPERSL